MNNRIVDRDKQLDEIVNLVQKFMQDYYKLRAERIKRALEYKKSQTGDTKQKKLRKTSC